MITESSLPLTYSKCFLFTIISRINEFQILIHSYRENGSIQQGIEEVSSVINTATNTVVGSPISVGAGPRGIAYDPVNGRMYVANSASNTVSVISTATNTVVGSPISVDSNPLGIAYDPVNGRMYVANSGITTDRRSRWSV
jgi:YVTN family beta-propeller protein